MSNKNNKLFEGADMRKGMRCITVPDNGRFSYTPHLSYSSDAPSIPVGLKNFFSNGDISNSNEVTVTSDQRNNQDE